MAAVSNDLCTVEVQENEVKVPPIADSKEPGLSDHLRPQQKCMPTNDEQQEQQAPEQKSKKRSSTRLRTKFQIEALTVELSKLRQENQFLRETWDSIQRTKQPKPNNLADGGIELENDLREIHLDEKVPQVNLGDYSDQGDTDLSNSERSRERKQYNYMTKDDEEIDYHQLFS